MNSLQTPFQDHPTPNDVLLWTKAYRFATVAALVLVVFLMSSGVSASRRTVSVIEPERINPNTASIGSLVRLPGIGRARALDILHFRQTNGMDGAAFKTADDLQQIRGIGPKTAEMLAPWLDFEEENTMQ